MTIVLLILAILPIILFALYINSKDNVKEPKTLLFALFLSGVLSSILVIIISLLMEFVFPLLGGNVKTMNALELGIYVFLGVASVEEGCKWFFTRIIGFNNKSFDQAYDIVVYATFVSLGFAFVENILYVLENGLGTAILRALTSIPSHTCFGIIMGYYLLLAKIAQKNNDKTRYRKNMLLSFFLPFLAHGIYDYCLLVGNGYLLLLLLIMIILVFIYCYKKIKQLSKLTFNLSLKNTHCPTCGRVSDTPFCPNCGTKNE